MKILFVCSGNENGQPGAVVFNQASSLEKKGLSVDIFLVKEGGFLGYIKYAFLLRKHLNEKEYDIIHAHYSLTGFVVLLSFSNCPKILSLMGSDTYGDFKSNGKIEFQSIPKILLTKIITLFFRVVIVKSQNIYKCLVFKNKIKIIPNGVDILLFRELDKKEYRKKVELDNHKNYILFLGNRKNPRKNFKLLEESLAYINYSNTTFINPYPIDPLKVPHYLNAADVLVLTSRNEGSPNIIKEAMACNRPIVSTRVGDVEWLLGNTEGCYLTSFDPQDVAEKLEKALRFSKERGQTTGRERIFQLGLDADTVASKIIDVYKSVLET